MTSERKPLAPWDVVVVPFPFTDRNAAKRRPALVLSNTELIAKSGTVVLAMITSAANAAWPHDVAIEFLKPTGLHAQSLVRWKLFTIDQSIVAARIGNLHTDDRNAVRKAMRLALGPA